MPLEKQNQEAKSEERTRVQSGSPTAEANRDDEVERILGFSMDEPQPQPKAQPKAKAAGRNPASLEALMGDRTCAVQGLPVFRDETDGWDNHIRPGDKVLEVGQPVGNPGVEVVLVRKHKGINPSDEELALLVMLPSMQEMRDFMRVRIRITDYGSDKDDPDVKLRRRVQ